MAYYNLQFYYHQNPSNKNKRSWNHKLGTTLFVTNILVHLLNGSKDQLEILNLNEPEFKFSILQELNSNRRASEFGFAVQVQIDQKQIIIETSKEQEIDNCPTLKLEQTSDILKQEIYIIFLCELISQIVQFQEELSRIKSRVNGGE
ncbi:unnamed protein product [Paramecium octaurelia]|uniref:Uncharacterized protein n=1 Tax=Paramecium octaurelia TaxID=43137 RepID=A0A8S1VZJ6_PAROT|nr:unnamed protein product [Paramecium octaurelia]